MIDFLYYKKIELRGEMHELIQPIFIKRNFFMFNVVFCYNKIKTINSTNIHQIII